jgi:DNA-binding MarR family transcriptional regulator
MRRLAEQMNCEASNLTGLVDRLEIRDLVERRPEEPAKPNRPSRRSR